MHLDPKLTHGPLRRPVELADQAVQAFVPARAVARGLAELAEGERAEFRVIHALSSGIHVVEVGFQRAEASGPGGAVGRQPLVDLAERFGPEPVHAPLRVGLHLDQARIAQYPQVLGHAGLAEAQRGHQVADGLVLLAEQVQDAAPVRLGQNLEHIANISVQLYNHQDI
jgi:hypothetical protein